jgi:hypothetical protein
MDCKINQEFTWKEILLLVKNRGLRVAVICVAAPYATKSDQWN